MSSQVLIMKFSLINPSLFYGLFSIFLWCLCVLRNPAVFDFITCQFLYRNDHSITKQSKAISCHSLFPAWECKQTWLLLNFVPTINFTSSLFLAYEKRQLGYVLASTNVYELPKLQALIVQQPSSFPHMHAFNGANRNTLIEFSYTISGFTLDERTQQF